jgi:hypothetical protein
METGVFARQGWIADHFARWSGRVPAGQVEKAKTTSCIASRMISADAERVINAARKISAA